MNPLGGRQFGLAFTPATRAATLNGGGNRVLPLERAEEAARPNYRMLGGSYRIDAHYRKLDLRSLSSQQIVRLHEVVEVSREEVYRDPVSAWTVSRSELQLEMLRRSGGGGLAFIPPVVALPAAAGAGVLVQAGRAALVAGLAYLIARLALNWGSVNSRQKPDGSGSEVPAWWPTGSYDPSGLNLVEFDIEQLIQSEAFKCEVRSSIQRSTASSGSGLVRFEVKEENPSGNTGPCGNVQAPDSAFGYVNQFGEFVPVSSTQTAARVVAVNYSNVEVRPYIDSPNAVPYPAAPKPLPLRPQVVPKPMPAVVPGTVPQPQREPEPVVVPGTVPLAPPANPNPARVPVAPPIVAPGSRPKLPPGEVGQSVGTDGKVQTPKPLPLPVTPPTTEIPWPGAPPIGQPGQQPRPDLVGIAQELGKIERKLAIMNTPSKPVPPVLDGLQMGDMLGLIWGLLQGFLDEGEYGIWSPCQPEGEPGSKTDPLVTGWGPSLTPFGGLENRLNALAQLIQDSKVLPQPTCRKPAVGGEPVTVQFESDDPSPAGEKRLRKVFRYLDQNFGQLEDHVQHWAEFSWKSGPWCVIHKGGVWGVPQVWAASADEGKRVIRHAASIAGVDVDATGSIWQVSRSSSSRTGQPGLMRVRRGTDMAWLISKRTGSNGLPEYLVPQLGDPAP